MTRNAFAIAAVVVAAVAAAQCGGAATAPTAAVSTVSGVTLSAPNVIVGGLGQGTVTLTAAALAGGASIALSSSNPAVATVPTTATIPVGASSVSFSITAVAPGTATFIASINGSSSQSPMFTVGPRTVALASLTLAQSTVVGGDSVTATATLTGAAPAGGAVVSLTGSDPASVPASVTVLTGFSSATFTVQTRAVGGTIAATVAGAYGGVSASDGALDHAADGRHGELRRDGPDRVGHVRADKRRGHAQLHVQRQHLVGTGDYRRLGLVVYGWDDALADHHWRGADPGCRQLQLAAAAAISGGHDVAPADGDPHGPRQPGERQRQGGQRRGTALRERRVRLLRGYRRFGQRQFCDA